MESSSISRDTYKKILYTLLYLSIIRLRYSYCIGYGFSEVRWKLKNEYQGKSGKEIGDLKKRGNRKAAIIIVIRWTDRY